MFDTGCCGADLRQEVISKWGVFSLAIPLFYFTIILFIIIWPLGQIITFFGKYTILIRKLLEANWMAIQRVQLLPKLKCNLSGFLYQASAWFAGQTFKLFNFCIFSFLWIFLIVVIKLSSEI